MDIRILWEPPYLHSLECISAFLGDPHISIKLGAKRFKIGTPATVQIHITYMYIYIYIYSNLLQFLLKIANRCGAFTLCAMPSVLNVLSPLILTRFLWSRCIISIFQKRILKLQVVNWFPQTHIQCLSQVSNPGSSSSEAMILQMNNYGGHQLIL